MQEGIGAEDDEHESEKNAGDDSGDFHVTMLNRSSGNAKSLPSGEFAGLYPKLIIDRSFRSGARQLAYGSRTASVYCTASTSLLRNPASISTLIVSIAF